jgi:hypothetical protein
MKHLIIGIIGLTITLISCNNGNQSSNSQKVDIVIDTLNSVRFGNEWITPKKAFDFNSFIDFQGDTLGIVTCADYVYSPFGLIQNKIELKSSNLSNFVRIDKMEKMENGEFEFQKLSLDSNRIILFFDNDPEASKSSYVFKGEIFDNKVVFDNDVKIGMTKKAFIEAFFDYFPENLINSHQTIVFESCVQDIRHSYRFNNDRLESVKFDSDSYWKVDYN